MKRMVTAAGVSLLLMLGGCGGDDDKVTEANDTPGATGGTSLAGSDDAGRNDTPDTPMGGDAMPGSDTPEEPTPEIVKPRPGMTNLRPVSWEKAEALSERKVLLTYYGGVEPCDVLDSVKVKYGEKTVTFTLFSGSDPKKPDAVCIEIAQLKAVEVDLTEDLDGRALKDGAPDAAGAGGQTDPAAAPAGKMRGDAEAIGLEPKPGQANVQAITWDRYEMLDENTVRVYFMSGVEPCHVLDSVKVTYAKEVIRIAVRMGSDPKQPDTACPALARFAYTDVDLTDAVGGREIVDDQATD